MHQSEKLRLTFTVVQENLRIQSYIILSIRKYINNKTTNELISNKLQILYFLVSLSHLLYIFY